MHLCVIHAQCHIEGTEIEKVNFTFEKIAEKGRLRISQCDVGGFGVGSSSVFGRVDIIESTIMDLDLEELHVPGYLNFQNYY